MKKITFYRGNYQAFAINKLYIDCFFYCFSNQAKISGTTMVASDSTMNLGVWMSSLPQVIFSLGTAPE